MFGFPQSQIAGLVKYVITEKAGCALPFASWRGLVKNILIAWVVTYAAIAGAIVMGMVFHLGIFGEPVMID